jgi:hypothetical protein
MPAPAGVMPELKTSANFIRFPREFSVKAHARASGRYAGTKHQCKFHVDAFQFKT